MPYRPAPRLLRLGPPDGPGGLWDEVPPARFPDLRLRFRNTPHAARVGLDGLDAAAWERHFARFEPLPDNLPAPLALRYHGHQFRHYNPRLGDGRGFLFAQLRDADGRLLDLGTKGSGTTPWSRGGDGRLTLKGGVREILATEGLEALGVDTSKTFSLFETGESLTRHDEPSPTRGSVLVRLSHGHLRIGTLQRLAALGDKRGMAALLAYVGEELLPGVDGPEALLRAVVHRTARTTAQWMVAGFVHGVLNTDNINLTGESFDYGPWRFLVTYDPDFTAAYFDEEGLYAYGQQPIAVQWNLARLQEALSLLAPVSTAPLAEFVPVYRETLRAQLRWRLGLRSAGPTADDHLARAVFAFLEAVRLPVDRFFFDAWGGEVRVARALGGPFARAYTHPLFGAVRDAWRDHPPLHPGRLADPLLDRPGPPTLVIATVEAVWDAIDREDDWAPLERLVTALRDWGALLRG